MFEYLMPLLVMPTYEGTLLDQTYRQAVARQIAYGRTRGVPWGISESGYNAVDVSLNYQYRAFGVPGLGLKRGLAEDLVVAPYASALALMVAPEAACLNLERLAAAGFAGKYGFYEAIDYTLSRLPQASAVVVPSSQGMSSSPWPMCSSPMQHGGAHRTRRSRRPRCSSRSGCQRPRHPVHTADLSEARSGCDRPGDSGAGLRHAGDADPGSATPVERPLPRDGYERGRRLQPLEGYRGDALARRPHLRQLGHVRVSA